MDIWIQVHDGDRSDIYHVNGDLNATISQFLAKERFVWDFNDFYVMHNGKRVWFGNPVSWLEESSPENPLQLIHRSKLPTNHPKSS